MEHVCEKSRSDDHQISIVICHYSEGCSKMDTSASCQSTWQLNFQMQFMQSLSTCKC